MYDREVDGRELSFGVSGKLVRNVLVMYDRQTDSLWSQLLGEAIEGELTETKLSFLPSWMTTWAEWQAMYPQTVALDKNGRRGAFDSYDDYFASPSAGVIGQTFSDPRLDTKAFIIGVALPEEAVAYPFATLAETPVVNDTIGGRPVVVVFDAENLAGVVYDRAVGGQVLTFAPGDRPTALVDNETGTVWDGFTGRATAGPLAGRTLARVPSTRSFWFGWKDFYPQTRIYGRAP